MSRIQNKEVYATLYLLFFFWVCSDVRFSGNYDELAWGINIAPPTDDAWGPSKSSSNASAAAVGSAVAALAPLCAQPWHAMSALTRACTTDNTQTEAACIEALIPKNGCRTHLPHVADGQFGGDDDDMGATYMTRLCYPGALRCWEPRFVDGDRSVTSGNYAKWFQEMRLDKGIEKHLISAHFAKCCIISSSTLMSVIVVTIFVLGFVGAGNPFTDHGASGSCLDLDHAPYVLYGVKYIDLVTPALFSGAQDVAA